MIYIYVINFIMHYFINNMYQYNGNYIYLNNMILLIIIIEIINYILNK